MGKKSGEAARSRFNHVNREKSDEDIRMQKEEAAERKISFFSSVRENGFPIAQGGEK